jgi:hypothetical protein
VSGEPLPTTLGVCPVCWGEFSVPDAKPGDTCPNGPHWVAEDDPDYNPPLVIYERAES